MRQVVLEIRDIIPCARLDGKGTCVPNGLPSQPGSLCCRLLRHGCSFNYSKYPAEEKQLLQPAADRPRLDHIRPWKHLQSQIGDGRVVVQLASLPLGNSISRRKRARRRPGFKPRPSQSLFCTRVKESARPGGRRRKALVQSDIHCCLSEAGWERSQSTRGETRLTLA